MNSDASGGKQWFPPLSTKKLLNTYSPEKYIYHKYCKKYNYN